MIDPDFTEEQMRRYARHIILPEVGGEGQRRLLDSRVLVVGAGGLGSPVILYLAAAGVGTIHIIDSDWVEESNLQRQVIHTMGSLTMAKTESARQAVHRINPDVAVVPHARRLTPEGVDDLLDMVDLVADGSDNFETRFTVADACHRRGRPLVSAAVLSFDGQLSTFRSHEPGRNRPCYRCLHREAPAANSIPTCSQAGILGAVAGVMGTLQATEVLKELLGLGTGLSGRLVLYDGLSMEFRTVRLRRDPDCPLCGKAAGA